MTELWRRCLDRLEAEVSAEDIHTWLAPLQASEAADGLRLWAPNAYTMDTVRERFASRIGEVLASLGAPGVVEIHVGGRSPARRTRTVPATPRSAPEPAPISSFEETNLDPNYTFDNFVEGKQNQLGRAAAMQVAQNPGQAYNPLLLYGSTGLGKTHLMHAAGNLMRESRPGFKILYLRAEAFVIGMVRALQQKGMDEFKRRYRSVDALLIDDIQLFAGKNTTQEEFFHTFNALLEGKQQIILTCDRYPKQVDNLEPRLKSRLGWGLSVLIDPPDFETRAAILLAKAQAKNVGLPEEVAALMAKHIRSHVRDLEGALNTLIARSHFEGRTITTQFAQETLRDLLNVHAQAVTIPNIQKTVADYYQLRLGDLLSTKRSRSIARPRQVAMALTKELTEHSLPEIGDAFGGRDHTTVLHACRTVKKLRDTDGRLRNDWDNLIRTLSE